LPRVCPKTDGHDRLLMAGFGLTFFTYQRRACP